MEITKIVITGGPCAGKSTALSRIAEEFKKQGYKVFIIAETATELITGGITPKSFDTVAQYQSYQLKLQLDKEKVFESAAKEMGFDKTLIVCDRGALDCKAYISPEEFRAIISNENSSEVGLRDSYDAVFHLITAAKQAREFYTVANNSARTETAQQAAELDDKIISAWTGHPHFRVIDNSTDFEGKIKRLIKEISHFLGEPEPYEIERKFLIEYPDIALLESDPNCQKIEILQTYLKSDTDEEVRLRRRGVDGDYLYYVTRKRKISDIKRIEVERRLTRQEYEELQSGADTTKRPIEKTRYCLTYDCQYFEIDIYPFWKDKAILEIELSDENAQITFPQKIKLIKEVTGNREFKNSVLAQIKEL